MLRNRVENTPDSPKPDPADQKVLLEVEEDAMDKSNCTPETETEIPFTNFNDSSYNLVRDRERRQIRPPQRYGYADIIAYALSVEEEDQENDPINYKEAISGIDSNNWRAAMD